MLQTMEKSAQTDHPIHELLRKRWSPRAFSPAPIEAEKMARLFEAARWAASSRNEQPWRFLVATKEDGPAYDMLLSSLMEGNRVWASTAPVLILGIAKRTWDHNGQPNGHARYDLGQAVAHLTVQASAEDLYLRQMGGFSPEAARHAFNIPEDFEPVVVLAIGYLGDPNQLPDPLKEREMAPRSRKPLESFVYAGGWNMPWHK